MNLLAAIEAIEARVEKLVKTVLALGISLEPLAEGAEVLTGNPELVIITKGAAAVAQVAVKAMEDHEAQGSTAASATATLATIAAAVANNSGALGIDPDTAAKITNAVNLIDPAIMQGLTGG